jgi:hypothetical protein
MKHWHSLTVLPLTIWKTVRHTGKDIENIHFHVECSYETVFIRMCVWQIMFEMHAEMHFGPIYRLSSSNFSWNLIVFTGLSTTPKY